MRVYLHRNPVPTPHSSAFIGSVQVSCMPSGFVLHQAAVPKIEYVKQLAFNNKNKVENVCIA
jgi:hypothetical protein